MMVEPTKIWKTYDSGKMIFRVGFPYLYQFYISISSYIYMLNYWRTAGHWEILSETSRKSENVFSRHHCQIHYRSVQDRWCGLVPNSRVDFPARVCDISETKLVESSLIIHHHVTGHRSRFSGFYIQTSLMVLWAVVTCGVIVVYNHGSSISNGYTLWQFNIVFENCHL